MKLVSNEPRVEGQELPYALYVCSEQSTSVSNYVIRALMIPIPIWLTRENPARRSVDVGWYFLRFVHEWNATKLRTARYGLFFYWHPWKIRYVRFWHEVFGNVEMSEAAWHPYPYAEITDKKFDEVIRDD